MTLPEQTIRNMTAEELAVYAEASCDYSQDTMQAMQMSFDSTLESTQESLDEANENVERLEAALKIALNDLKKIRKLSDEWLEDERSVGEASEKVMCRIDSIADGGIDKIVNEL